MGLVSVKSTKSCLVIVHPSACCVKYELEGAKESSGESIGRRQRELGRMNISMNFSERSRCTRSNLLPVNKCRPAVGLAY